MIWIVSHIDKVSWAGKNVGVGARDLGGIPTGSFSSNDFIM